jgi:hypothetical protein
MFETDMLTDIGREFADIEVRACSDDELLTGAVGLELLISFAQTAQAHVLAELDGRGTTDRVHGMRTTAWVSAAAGCARGPITGRLRVGRSLRNHFDRVDEAVCDGRLTFDHAKTLSDVDNPRITDILTGSQDEIIALAETSTFPQWKRDMIALAEHADADGKEPDPYEGNELQLAKTLDGSTDLTGTLDAANGLLVRNAIAAMTDELFKRFRQDHDLSGDLTVPRRNVLQALALAELIRTAIGAEPGSGSSPHAEVTLVLHDHETCDAEGTPLPRAAADVWGCDPDLWAVIVNHMGVPTDVGHTARLATTAQRRAIAVRDGGCTFPGCDAPVEWCDHHHALDWRKGGSTDLSNLVALCRHHHGVTHRTGWTMTLDDDQIPHWTSPSGDHLVGQRHHRRARCAAPDRPADRPSPALRSSERTREPLRRSDHSHRSTPRRC